MDLEVTADVETSNSQLQDPSIASNHDVLIDVESTNSHVQVDGVVDDDLIGVVATSEKEAFDIYNDYAFNVGFSVRKSKQRQRVDKSISMKIYLCSRAGCKRKKPSDEKAYSKLDVRTNCPALVQYNVDKDGVWVISKHVKAHNHELCPAGSSYLLRSHRRVSKIQLAYLLRELQKSGVKVADGVGVLKNQSGGSNEVSKNQSGGSPFVGAEIQNTYNALGNSMVLDGTDSNMLIQIFRKRQTNENDFFFDYEFDNESRLCSLFWRDGRMKQDYIAFSDLLVLDTTYRTNKYDMICAPFVGMDHHGMHVMFGCGFLLKERIESIDWLFRTFLKSMDHKQPVTIMTDQCAPMSAAISKIFPLSRHRLCIWLIEEDSREHIKSLRGQKDFINLFNYALKNVDTVAEFEHHWDLMTTRFECKNNKWLVKLYELKEKWCPAFSKTWFSGGILSSQMSKNTHHSISRRLSKRAGLCDLYNCFVGVISEWRSKENDEDVRCSQGKAPMALSGAKLLLHARDVYTIMVYSMFEKEFMKGLQCHQSLVSVDVSVMKYHVWFEGDDKIKHEVDFDMTGIHISCSCKFFEEVGILCNHCLRILNIHCVSAIPEFYILKRWCKNAVNDRIFEGDLNYVIGPSNSMATPSWRYQMFRKFYKLICASEDNSAARLKCEEAFEFAKCSIMNEIGPVYFDDTNDVTSSSSSIIQNPQSMSIKSQSNKRPESSIEKKYNQSHGKRSRAETADIQTKIVVQNMQGGVDSYVADPTSES